MPRIIPCSWHCLRESRTVMNDLLWIMNGHAWYSIKQEKSWIFRQRCAKFLSYCEMYINYNGEKGKTGHYLFCFEIIEKKRFLVLIKEAKPNNHVDGNVDNCKIIEPSKLKHTNSFKSFLQAWSWRNFAEKSLVTDGNYICSLLFCCYFLLKMAGDFLLPSFNKLLDVASILPVLCSDWNSPCFDIMIRCFSSIKHDWLRYYNFSSLHLINMNFQEWIMNLSLMMSLMTSVDKNVVTNNAFQFPWPSINFYQQSCVVNLLGQWHFAHRAGLIFISEREKSFQI